MARAVLWGICSRASQHWRSGGPRMGCCKQAAAKAVDLREDEPHPVALLFAELEQEINARVMCRSA
jgi:hypothetical protein